MKDALRSHESLRSVKADTFATLVSRSMPCGSRATLHDGTHVREATARVAVGDRNRLAVLALAMSDQVFVDVIIARQRAPSHRVFVAQVFRRNMCGKWQRRHRFSAFWLRSSVACVTSQIWLRVISLFPAFISVLFRHITHPFVPKKIIYLLVQVWSSLVKDFQRKLLLSICSVVVVVVIKRIIYRLYYNYGLFIE